MLFGKAVVVVVDELETAQHEAAEIAKDGTLARGHAALGHEFVEGDQRMVHLLCGLKIAATVDKVSGEINKFGGLHGGMASTERCVWRGSRRATLTAAGSEVLASLRSGCGITGFGFHGCAFLRWQGVYPTRVILKKRLQMVENKERRQKKSDKEALHC
jgi:hypothetical protein